MTGTLDLQVFYENLQVRTLLDLEYLLWANQIAVLVTTIRVIHVHVPACTS